MFVNGFHLSAFSRFAGDSGVLGTCGTCGWSFFVSAQKSCMIIDNWLQLGTVLAFLLTNLLYSFSWLRRTRTHQILRGPKRRKGFYYSLLGEFYNRSLVNFRFKWKASDTWEKSGSITNEQYCCELRVNRWFWSFCILSGSVGLWWKVGSWPMPASLLGSQKGWSRWMSQNAGWRSMILGSAPSKAK